jgi:CBS domain-containing protein
MQVKDCMLATTEVVHLDQNLRDACDRLRRFHIPALPVVDGDEIVGLLSAEAVEEMTAAPDDDLGNIAVRDHMSAEIAFCRADEPIETARSIMQDDGHDRLLVLDGKGRLCGLLLAEDVGAGRKADTATPHVVKTPGRAKGGKLHQPDSYSVRPIVKK